MEITVGECIKPITITLQTQREINQLYAILNLAPISRAIDADTNAWYQVRKALEEQKSEDYHKWHNKLSEMEL